MRISPEPKNQQVDLTLIDMFQYLSMRLSHTDKGMRLANLFSEMGHDRFNSTVKMLLKHVELVRMVYLARMNDVKDI